MRSQEVWMSREREAGSLKQNFERKTKTRIRQEAFRFDVDDAILFVFHEVGQLMGTRTLLAE
jgi:hypothetical protein